MSAALNLLWFLIGGFWSGLAWFVAGCLAAITVVGLPWTRSCFVLANFSMFPVGRDVISRSALTGQKDLGTGVLGILGNVIWFLAFGWLLALNHIVLAITWAITLIGIPFAIQHLKLGGAAMFPIGRTVRSVDLVREAKHQNTLDELDRLRGRRGAPAVSNEVNVTIKLAEPSDRQAPILDATPHRQAALGLPDQQA